jgi:hypothetical protein
VVCPPEILTLLQRANGASSPSFLTSLDEREFPVDRRAGHRENATQRWWFAHCAQERALTLAVIPAVDPSIKTGLAHQLCGSAAWVYADASGSQATAFVQTCGNRCCPRCSFRWRYQVVDAMITALGSITSHSHKLITLTLRSTDEPLRRQISSLRSSFRRLRQHHLWSRLVRCGHCVVEVTRSAETGRWHPHLHVIARSRYFPQAALADSWEIASKGSRIVDVREVKSSAQVARYLAKYLGKSLELQTLRPSQAHQVFAEYYLAIRRAKLHWSFGDTPPIVLQERLSEALENEWFLIGPLSAVLAAANAGNIRAAAILRQLRSSAGRSPPLGAPHASKDHVDITIPGQVQLQRLYL